MRKGPIKSGLLSGLVCLVASLGVAPGALASTVTVSGGNTVKVGETGNEVNRISVSYDAGVGRYTVNDSSANLAPSGTCTAVNVHTATCPGTGIKTISVATDQQNDTIALGAGIPPTATGVLDGGSGNDTITGSPRADSLRGGSGRDTLDGGNGPDDIAGGSGTDTLLYPADRATPVAVTVGNGSRDDGGVEDQGPGGRDTVHGDVEVVIGTAQDDLLAGDSSSETLIGGAGGDTLLGNNGSDTLLGLEGDDLIVGGNGRDLLRGWLGADRLFGGPDGDRVSGGPDNDLVVGNRGRDILKGKGGIDFLRAKDGFRDVRIKCGRGNNRLEGATRDRYLDPRPRSC